MTAAVALPFRVGTRNLFAVRRRLVHRAFGLEEMLAGRLPALPPLGPGDHGYWLRSVPVRQLGELERGQAGLRRFVRQTYARSYADLDGTFDGYLAGFSAKGRSTLKRKARKLAERSGGALDVRCYRTPEEVEEFHRLARPLSARTYQEKLLDYGLPDGEEALAAMRALARADALRCWLLFLDGRPVAYLYAPAEGDALVYAYLGYDPAVADLSPGTVLQFEAMRRLFDEGRFRWFDFAEGEGRHKRQFATGSVDCADLLLLRPTPANLVTGYALDGFDRTVAWVKRRFGEGALARRFRR